MTVTKDDLHALDQRINDHKLEVYKTMTEAVAGPMNNLTQEIREMTGEFRAVKEEAKTFRQDILEVKENHRKDNLSNKETQHLMAKDIVLLQAYQANSKNFWDKFGVPIMFMAIAGLTTINYFKV